MNNFYAALDLGTTRTVLAIGEAESGGRLRVTCHAEIPSSGIRKSQIFSIPDATQSIRSVLRAVERKQDESGAKVTIGNAFLVVTGSHVRADSFSGTVHVEGAKVSADDMDAAFRAARPTGAARDRELLDVVDQDYMLDGLGGIMTPKVKVKPKKSAAGRKILCIHDTAKIYLCYVISAYTAVIKIS